MDRNFTPFDRLVMETDAAMRTLFGAPQITERANPASGLEENELSPEEKRHAAGLMRVNHAGEVAAQALYQGQALTARLAEVRDKMERAALEENDHLAWCGQRVHELGQQTSRLNPVWYLGSLAIGAAAGIAGDRWSLGFVAETEHQVVRHLDRHLDQLSSADARSRAILEQMKEDEQHHATVAIESGGGPLPAPIKSLMTLSSRVMTTVAYYL